MMAAFIKAVDPAAEVVKAVNLSEALPLVANGGQFALILLDLNMPGVSGLAAFERLQVAAPGQRIAIISGQTHQSEIRAALKAGAVGFIPKNVRGDIFMEALKLMLAGGRYLPEALLNAGVEVQDISLGDFGDLKVREREVLDALLGGRSNLEIADHLALSEVTVKGHLQRIFRKIGAKNRGDAIRIGLQRRL